MKNPYAELPSWAFWRRSISQTDSDLVDPIIEAPFKIDAETLVATAGSCFAQHISRMLVREGFCYLVTEPELEAADRTEGTQGTFSARYGNIYTVRQLLQLFDRAYGLFCPCDAVWQRSDGAFVDPFRPRNEAAGFVTADALIADRKSHLAAVRELFERCDVFIYTLGLTEGWISTVDGAVFPLAPGVAGSGPDPASYQFENFAVDGMIQDLLAFIDKLRAINQNARFVLTVSPVPLIATYEHRHVLVSNTYSKSALRVVAEVVSRSRSGVAYFPSYEMITGLHQRSRFYADDLREVTSEGVAHVMSFFKKHYLSANKLARGQTLEQGIDRPRNVYGSQSRQVLGVRSNDEQTEARLAELSRVVCEEELLDPILHEPSRSP